MAMVDMDSARGKHSAGSPGVGVAPGKRNSPRASSVGARSFPPDQVAEAKAKAQSGDPERRVLFTDAEATNDGAVHDDFGEDSETEEAEEVMPTQAAPGRDRADPDGEKDADADDEEMAKHDDAHRATPVRLPSFGGFARSVANGLGAVGLGAVASSLWTPTVKRQDDLDSARKAGASPDAGASSPPEFPNSPTETEEPTETETDAEDQHTLDEARSVFFAKVFDETGVTLHDGWSVKFEWSTKRGHERRRRKRFFAPDGHKFSDATKVVQLITKQRDRGDIDVPVLVAGAMPADLTGRRVSLASAQANTAHAVSVTSAGANAVAVAVPAAPTPTITKTKSPAKATEVASVSPNAGGCDTIGDQSNPNDISSLNPGDVAGPSLPAPHKPDPPSPESKDKDPFRNVDGLRRKVKAKLAHDLEDGWSVTWETSNANGRDRDEKVWRDPLAPQKRLVGDAQALTHVKMRLAAATVQRRAAAVAATKMAADAKTAEEKCEVSFGKLAAEVTKTSDPAAMLVLSQKMETARADLSEKREWALFAQQEADTALSKIAAPANLVSPKRSLGVGATPLETAGKSRDYRRNSHNFTVPQLPSAVAASPGGSRGVLVLTGPKATPVSAAALALAMFTPADREEEARRQLVERVYAETGVRLGPDWRVKMSVHSNGKEGNIADREYKRFFSPGGKRFESAGAIVSHVLDFKKRAICVEGEATKSPEQLETERVEDEQFTAQEAAARRELIKQVFEETGVMLGANWRVQMERSWSVTKRKLVGRMRFFAPDLKKFSSKADVVEHVERQVKSGKLKRHSAPLKPRSNAAPISNRLSRNPSLLNERDREEEAAAELADRAKEATGVVLSPGWRVRWVKEDGGKIYKRFFDPKGKRYSNLGAAIRQVQRDNGIDVPEPRDDRARREDDGARNLAAAMDLAADETDGDDEFAANNPRGSRRIAANQAKASADKEQTRAACERQTRPSRQQEKEKAEKRALLERANAEKAAEKARRAMANAEKALRRAEKAGAVAVARTERDLARAEKEKTLKEKGRVPSLLALPSAAAAGSFHGAEKGLAAVTPASAADDNNKKRRKATPPTVLPYLPSTQARNMSAVERESIVQVSSRVTDELGLELNKGWRVQITQRKSGVTVGATDKYFIPPPQPADAPEGFRTKSKYRSEGEVVEYVRRLNGLGSSKKRKRDKTNGVTTQEGNGGGKKSKSSRSGARKPKETAKAKMDSRKTGKTVSSELAVGKRNAGTKAGAKRLKQSGNTHTESVAKESAGLLGDNDEDVWGVVESEDESQDEDESEDDDASESDESESESESDEVSDSEEEDPQMDGDDDDDADDVRVEGMLTVVDADAKRVAFEQRVLTPAKVRELELHIEHQLANPAMGFDVDVLQLEYQRVTGFEALSDDAMELREMLQNVVQREKEKALAASAGGGGSMFSPDTVAAVSAAEKDSNRRQKADAAAFQKVSAAALPKDSAAFQSAQQNNSSQDDIAFPDDSEDDEAFVKGKDTEFDEPDEGDHLVAVANVAVATTIEAMRAVSGEAGVGVDGSKKTGSKNARDAGENRGARVVRTLGNVGVKRAREEAAEVDEGDGSDDEETDDLSKNVTKKDEADTTTDHGEEDEASPHSTQEDAEPVTKDAALRGAHRVASSRWNPKDSQMTALAKSVLHTSTAPSAVMCRETERKQVLDLLKKSLKTKRSGSVYVCGLPGTGKSLTVSEAEQVARAWGDGSSLGGGAKYFVKHRHERVKVASVNCMALGDPRAVFAKVIEELGGVPPNVSGTNSELENVDLGADLGALPEVTALRQLVCRNPGQQGGVTTPTVILLDEMDQLVSKAQGILYELFGLPTLAGSACLVVGVANGINLVESSLPRLASRGCEPTVVRFNAYDKTQIKSLLRQRLGELPFTVFEDAGLELCARKVAAATGDMRRALNIACVAIDLCAQEAAEAVGDGLDDMRMVKQSGAGAGDELDLGMSKQSGGGASSSVASSTGSLVKIAHMARAISASFSSPVVDTMRGLPQHQQMVLCAAVRLFREKAKGQHGTSSREATLGVLNDRYTALCKEACIRGLTPGEVSGVCTVLADQTLLKVGSGREDRQRKVSLAVHQDDVVFALQGVNFFRNLIGEGRGGTGGGARR